MMTQTDPISVRGGLEAEKAKLERRLTEVNRLLNAFKLLEASGVAFTPNGSQRQSGVYAEIRELVLGFAGKTPFGMREVLNGLHTKLSRMTVRTALQKLVGDGTLVIARRGSRGRATTYQVSVDALPDSVESDHVGTTG